MKKHQFSDGDHRQQQESSEEKQNELEFGHADEMIRHDALRTPVPPAIGERLAESLRNLPRGEQPWWRKWLGH